MWRWMIIVCLATLAAGCVTRFLGGSEVVLVRDGRPAATIVIADTPDLVPITDTDPVSHKEIQLTVAHAADELQLLIEKATGARLPIVAASNAPATGTLVLVGRSALSAKAGLTLPSKPEGLRVVTFARGLAILGEVVPKGTHGAKGEMDRGTLFGVYEFVERVMGYRFYFYDEKDPELGMVTPRMRDVVAPRNFKLELAPDFPFRVACLAPVKFWNRVTHDGASTGFTANHTDTEWDGYRKEHPEYFVLQKDGTRSETALCYSEPKVLAQRLENVERFYKTGQGGGWPSPTDEYVPFVPRDAYQAGCQCARCLALTRKVEEVGQFGVASDIIFRHGADLAVEVNKRWPGRHVSMLAYQDYTLPPSFDLPDNLDVMVCQMHSGTMNKEPYWFQYNLKLLRDWSAKLGNKRERLYTWNYICMPGFWTSAPYIFPHSLRQWVQEAYPLSNGEVINPGIDRQREHFTSWLWHRLLWDRHADVDALLHDYATKFYGPAGKAMEDLYRLLGDRYENVHWSRQLGESYVPLDLMYLETFTPEAIAQLKKLSADALAACPSDPKDLYRRRVVWMQEQLTIFFNEADLAHKWLNHPPTYAAATVKTAPDEAAWAAVPSTSLAQGNFGAEPDLQTTVQVLFDGTNLYMRMAASLPSPTPVKDSLTLRTRAADGQQFWTLNADGAIEGKQPATLVSNQRTDKAWTVVVKIQAPGLAMAAQFERHMETVDKDKKPVVRDYAWSPQMAPPWPYPMRWGTLKVSP